ncbi:MAG TPA: class I SAM-dependent methyltransferase [Trebonia sp.]|nr:class I SAM-dependent methyltransferase [Trebonia sp.]
MAARDWYAWHAGYDRPGSRLAQRLGWVQERIRVALDAAPAGQLRAISLCAGQGRDLIGVLATHPRRDDVTARLVELDPRNTAVARRLAAGAGLTGIEIVTGDASLASQYASLVPAHLVVACGLFGNVTDADVNATIGYCTALCATGGTVVWTRGRRWYEGDRDLVPQVCAWFEERGFTRQWVSDPQFAHCCGAHVFTGTPSPLDSGAVMFTFVCYDRLAGPGPA